MKKKTVNINSVERKQRIREKDRRFCRTMQTNLHMMTKVYCDSWQYLSISEMSDIFTKSQPNSAIYIYIYIYIDGMYAFISSNKRVLSFVQIKRKHYTPEPSPFRLFRHLIKSVWPSAVGSRVSPWRWTKDKQWKKESTEINYREE